MSATKQNPFAKYNEGATEESKKPKANWIHSITVGPDVEVKISDKGYIGVWSRGRYACGMFASVLEALTSNPDVAQEVNNFARMGAEIFESTKPQRDETKLKLKLAKDAEALMRKAEALQQAGIDIAAILAKKQG